MQNMSRDTNWPPWITAVFERCWQGCHLDMGGGSTSLLSAKQLKVAATDSLKNTWRTGKKSLQQCPLNVQKAQERWLEILGTLSFCSAMRRGMWESTQPTAWTSLNVKSFPLALNEVKVFTDFCSLRAEAQQPEHYFQARILKRSWAKIPSPNIQNLWQNLDPTTVDQVCS